MAAEARASGASTGVFFLGERRRWRCIITSAAVNGITTCVADASRARAYAADAAAQPSVVARLSTGLRAGVRSEP